MESMIAIPISLLAPMTGLFYVSNLAEKLEINSHFLEYGFSPAVFKLITTSNTEKLPDIQSEFGPYEEK